MLRSGHVDNNSRHRAKCTLKNRCAMVCPTLWTSQGPESVTSTGALKSPPHDKLAHLQESRTISLAEDKGVLLREPIQSPQISVFVHAVI